MTDQPENLSEQAKPSSEVLKKIIELEIKKFEIIDSLIVKYFVSGEE